MNILLLSCPVFGISLDTLYSYCLLAVIYSKTDIHSKVKKTLDSLGLRKTFSGVFLKASKGTLAMLQKVEPYVTYGYEKLFSLDAI